jgi:hypothetical protein
LPKLATLTSWLFRIVSWAFQPTLELPPRWVSTAVSGGAAGLAGTR